MPRLTRSVFTSCVLCLATMGLVTMSLNAQTPAFRISGPTDVGLGQTFEATVRLDNPGPSSLEGWTYGVCVDPLLVEIQSVALGEVPLTANGGFPVDFHDISIQADGYAVACAISITNAKVLPPGINDELTIGTYSAVGLTPSTVLTTCDGQGIPPVQSVVVVLGQAVATDDIPLDLAIEVLNPSFSAIAPDVEANYGLTGALGFSVTVLLHQNDNGFPPAESQGFSLGLGHDASLFQVTSVEPALPFDPDFQQVGLADLDGWTIGVVYALVGGVKLVLNNQPVVTANYSNVDPSPLAGNDQPVTSTLEWSDGIGTPPVVNVVVLGGASFAPDFVNGTVTLNPPIVHPEFRRGDANQDSIVNLADGIWMLNQLFHGGPSFDCAGAADVNADDQLNAADAIFIFTWLFMGGSPPIAPYPECGLPVEVIPLPSVCESYLGC